MMSFLGVTLIFQLFARFFSRGLDMVSIWVGLIGLLGFILYDTQARVVNHNPSQLQWIVLWCPITDCSRFYDTFYRR